METAQFTPQGVLGNQLGTVLGNVLGNMIGQGQLGSQIGGLAGGLLPFQAGPQQAMTAPTQYTGLPTQYTTPQFNPQGVIGGQLGQVLGNAIGNLFGQGQLGSQIGGFAGNLLPFQAGPQQQMLGWPQQTTTQFSPQGVIGSQLGQALGNVLGNLVGQGQLGSQIGGFDFTTGDGRVGSCAIDLTFDVSYATGSPQNSTVIGEVCGRSAADFEPYTGT